MEKKKSFITTKRILTLKKENPYFSSYITAITELNRIYWTTKLSKDLIYEYREKLKLNTVVSIEIELPSVNGSEITKERQKGKVSDILKKAMRYDIFASSIVSSVTVVESYLESVIKRLYLKHPNKLTISLTKEDKEEEKNISIKSILNATSLEDLYKEVIDKKILRIMYLSPKEYFMSIKKTFGFNLEDELVDTFIEIKATRDLIVHSGGRVNSYYINKSGVKCRVTDTKQIIPLDIDYLLCSMVCMKKLITEIYKETSRIYLKKTKKSELFP